MADVGPMRGLIRRREQANLARGLDRPLTVLLRTRRRPIRAGARIRLMEGEPGIGRPHLTT
jgi:hypothetical protein